MRACTLAFLALITVTGYAHGALLVPEQYATIEAALAAAAYGDTVSLAAGAYHEHDLVLPPGVSVLGRGACREAVVIDAQGEGRVLWGENLDENNLLEGFTIRGGYLESGYGCGAYLDGDAILRNLIVEENIAQEGRGVGIYARYPSIIEDCVFRNNRSIGVGGGAGLYVYRAHFHTSTICRLDFIANESTYGAAAYICTSTGTTIESIRAFNNIGECTIHLSGGDIGAVLIENSVIAHNQARGIRADTHGGIILNCTILDCEGGVEVWGDPEQQRGVHIDNCIVAFNVDNAYGGVTCDGWIGHCAFLACSDVYGNLPANFSCDCWDQTGIDGNISEDPLFCPDAGPEDYPLQDTSPCAPANNDCGVLIGAFPVGCEGVATRAVTWTRVKQLY